MNAADARMIAAALLALRRAYHRPEGRPDMRAMKAATATLDRLDVPLTARNRALYQGPPPGKR